MRLLPLVLPLLLLALLGTGCTKEARKARALKQADAFFAAGDYEKAELEYKNALKAVSLEPHAMARLGILYFEQGRQARAMAFLSKAAELQPDNPEIQLKQAALLLAGGNLAEARKLAFSVLEKKPSDPEAPIMLAEISAQPRELAETRQRLQQLPPPANQAPAVQVALGILAMRERKAAEGEAAFRRALTADPKFAAAYSALAFVHLSRNELPQAEEALKQAAAFSAPRSTRLVQYAQFKIRQRDLAGGRAILEESTRTTPDYLPAWLALAELAESEGKREEGIKLTDQILARESAHAEAMLLRARLRVANGEFEKAITELEAMAGMFPRAPQVHFHLAQAFFATGNSAKASASLTQCLTLAPNFPDAVLLQATLNLRRGDFAPAANALRRLVQQRPDILQARLLLGDALRGQGSLEEAIAVYEGVEKTFPKLAQAPLLRGMILGQQRKPAEARQAFERALEIAPDFASAAEQLVALDFAENKSDAAKKRAEDFLAKNPKSIDGHILLARVMITRKDEPAAEAALQKAIAVQPESPVPYFMLARLQLSNREPAKAVANLEASLAKNPKSVETLMLLSIVHEQQNNFTAARDSYQKLIAVNPRFGPAYNNLAYILSEQLNQLDQALEMAQKARELLPVDPNVADTLGWILFRKGQYTAALPLLQESAGRLNTSAEVHYHLGMAQYMVGEESAARVALKRALELGGDFPGQAEARARLAALEIDPATAGPGVRAEVEKQLAERKSDPVLLARLAALLEREGAMDRALATYESALAASPNNATVMLGIIRLHEARKEPAKALEMARTARKAAPADPAVAQVLGRLASESGQHAWGYSLVQEAARRRPDVPEVLFDLATTAFTVGDTDEAETALRRVLELAPAFPKADQVRRFLELAAIVKTPGESSAAARAEAAAKAAPDFLPALTAVARVKEAKRDPAGARAAYEGILARYPDMVLAKQRLAILLAEAKDADPKLVLEYATKAREAYPEDPAVARALGIIMYRQGNYSRAATLLQESAAKPDAAADTFFFLGMARHRLKSPAAAKQALQRALELKLGGEQAAEAKKALAEIK